jgi:hypothetical protein
LDFDGYATSIGGVINVDGAGTISGAGSVYDVNDSLDAGLFQDESFTASTVSAPDAFGRVIFTLNNPVFGSFIFEGYIVDSTKIRLVETYTDGFDGTTGGTAFSQGANTGTFTAASAAGQTYVIGMIGWETSDPLQFAGQLTLNADGSVTGFMNYNDFTGTEPQTPSALTAGSWVQDPTTGRITLTGIEDATTTSFSAQLYPDGNGNTAALTMDATDAIGGLGYLQTATGTPTGAYAAGATGWELGDQSEFDAVGPVTSDGNSSITGFADVNWLFSEGPTYPDSPVAASFTTPANGTSTGTVTGLDVDNCSLYGVGAGCTNDVFVYYVIDAGGDFIAIETDINQETLGYFLQQ